MKHTEKCLAIQAEMKRKHDEYVALYPNYCRKCGGVGEVTWQENQSPLGSGMVWLETIADWCESCLCTGKCPRCGEYIGEWNDDEQEAPHCGLCGWKMGDDSGCPPAGLEYPCECELSAEPEDMPY